MWLPRRVDKFLRECTHRSLAELREACANGRVMVADVGGIAQVVAADDLVFEGDRVALDQQSLPRRLGYDYLAFHKPVGTISTVRDPAGLADLSEWLPQLPEGVFPVGRLDRMTSGLLLWTSDGDLAHAILHPEHHVEKCYWLWLDEQLDVADPRLARLLDGVEVKGQTEPLRALSVAIASVSAEHTELQLTLREGKNRQIRKMCQALGLRLVGLHRKAVGSVGLDGLAAGDWRHLSPEEVADLWEQAGGRSLVQRRQLQALLERAAAARAAHRPIPRLEEWLDLHTDRFRG